MTAEWYDLGQRFRAATENHALPRLRHAPIVAVPHPVAVRAHRSRDQITVTATLTGQAPATATGSAALDLLGTLGVTLAAPQAATLVTDDPATLTLLHKLALTAEPGTDHDTVAAHIAWWRDRSDFPAGRAVVYTTTHCRQRWITGTAPDAENDPATWRQWLGMTDDSTQGLMDLHTRLTAGPALDYLDTLAETDEWFYSTAQSHHNDGRDWRRPDSTYRAALGLRERCDAADLYAAALLTDPLHRRRAVHTGEVVLGTAHPLQGRLRSVEVTCARMDARLRPGADVTGWAGGPGVSGPRFSGTVATAAVRSGSLIITLIGVTGQTPDDTESVTLLPTPPSVFRLRAGRRRYRDLYQTRRSWLTTGRTPTPTRRTVPLDVLIAGAEPD